MTFDDNYEIVGNVDNKHLLEVLEYITSTAGDKIYRHTTDKLYYAENAVVININGKSYYGLTYYPFNEDNTKILHIAHTRPLYEFLDGRFTLITPDPLEAFRKRINGRGADDTKNV